MKVQRILFPTDFSDLSKTAEQTACDFAEHFGAELHVLHVLQALTPTIGQAVAALLVPPTNLVDLLHMAEQEIQQIPQSELATGKRVVHAVRSGPSAGTIVQYANENAIDLIVIGTHGRTGLPHVLLGSVAEQVVQSAPCPVLTVRHHTVQRTKNTVQNTLKTA